MIQSPIGSMPDREINARRECRTAKNKDHANKELKPVPTPTSVLKDHLRATLHLRLLLRLNDLLHLSILKQKVPMFRLYIIS